MTETMKTGHDLPSVFTLNFAFPIVGIFFAVFFLVILRLTLTDLMHRWGYVITKGEIQVDEDQPDFFSCVPLS